MKNDVGQSAAIGRQVRGDGAAIVAPAITGTLNIGTLPRDVVVGRLRAGLYAIARGDHLLGRVRGDQVAGYEALLPNGRRAGDVTRELADAVEQLLVEGSWSA